MGPILAVASGAGLASALLFATLASGSPFAIILFYFAALPVLIAGLGWGHYAGAFAATVGALALSLSLSSHYGLFYFFSVGLPSWVLAHLALLERRAPAPDGGEVHAWTPPGLLLAAIGIGAVALTLFGIVVLFGFDMEAYRASLREAVERALRQMAAPGADIAVLTAFMTAAVPVAAAVVWTFVTTLNLFIAATIVRASGRLVRPWPDLPSLRLPRAAAAALIVGSIVSFMPGFLGHAAAIVVAVGLAIFALAGYALVHDLTRGWNLRGVALGLLYALTFMIGWPAIFVAMAGLADVLFDLRGRRGASPPS